jgi:hypothetical protein
VLPLLKSIKLRARAIALWGSAAIFLLVVALWVRSEFRTDWIRYGTDTRFFEYRSKRGYVSLGVPFNMRSGGKLWNGVPQWTCASCPVGDDRKEFYWGHGHPYLRALGVRIAPNLYGAPKDWDFSDRLVVPYAWLAALAALPGGWWLVRQARASRGPLGIAYRAIGTGIAAISLLLMLILGAAWVRSYWVCDVVQYDGPPDSAARAFWIGHPAVTRTLRSLRGAFYYEKQEGDFFSAGLSTVWGCGHLPADEAASYWPQSHSLEGRDEYIHATPYGWNEHDLSIPIAWCVAAFAIAPAVWVWRFRRGRKRRLRSAGLLCPYCGYDLRASSGRCPECGNAMEGTTAGSLSL